MPPKNQASKCRCFPIPGKAKESPISKAILLFFLFQVFPVALQKNWDFVAFPGYHFMFSTDPVSGVNFHEKSLRTSQMKPDKQH